MEILAEIENILKKIEGTRLSNLNDNLSTRLETIERKLGDLESMLSRIGPHYSSAQLNNLIEEIVTSRIRSDLESSVQALHLLQAYLRDGTKNARGFDDGAPTPDAPVEKTAQPSPERAHTREASRNSAEVERIVPKDENIFERMLENADQKDRAKIEKMSRRKRETLIHLLLGKNNSDIAEELGVTEKTVKNNLYAIYRIFRVRSRSELIYRLLNPLEAMNNSTP